MTTHLELNDGFTVENGGGGRLQGATPPDAGIACGKDYIVIVINSDIVVIDRSYNSTVEHHSLKDFFGVKAFDPRAFYDPMEDQFVVGALHNDCDNNDGRYIISATEYGDPTYIWNTWKIPVENGYKVDFPYLAFDENHIYMTANKYGCPNTNNNWLHSWMVTISKARIYGGYSANSVKYDLGDENWWTPCINYDSTDSNLTAYAITADGEDVLIKEIKNPNESSPNMTEYTITSSYSTAKGRPTQPKGFQPELNAPSHRITNPGVIHENSLRFAHQIGDVKREHSLRAYDFYIPTMYLQDTYDWRGPENNNDWVFIPATATQPNASDPNDATALTFARSNPYNEPQIWVSAGFDEDPLECKKKVKSGESSMYKYGENKVRFGDYYDISPDPNTTYGFVSLGQYPHGSYDDMSYGMHVQEFKLQTS